MKKLIVLVLFCIVVVNAFADEVLPEDGCVTCHMEIDEDFDNPIMTEIVNDVHFKVGLSCTSCHGGDPAEFDDSDAAMWDNDTFLGAIDKQEQIKVCSSCHSDNNYMRQYSTSIRTDQADQYWTSHHGELLKSGDNKVASCTNCHGVHGIYPIDDPRSKVYPLNIPNTCSTCHSDNSYMAEYNIATDQLNQFKQSVHGIALLEKQDIYSPACNDCHGNHGATPPEVSHISDICGSCHVNNKNLFQDSFHREYFVENDYHECEACHGNHEVSIPNDEMLNWENESICLECHNEDDELPKEMSLSFYNAVDSLKTQLQYVETLMADAENKGMEVSDMYIHLEDAHRLLIQTRTNIHSFDSDMVTQTSDDGHEAIKKATIIANNALDELGFRRKGLLIFSLIMTLSIIAIYLKLKSMQGKKKN